MLQDIRKLLITYVEEDMSDDKVRVNRNTEFLQGRAWWAFYFFMLVAFRLVICRLIV